MYRLLILFAFRNSLLLAIFLFLSLHFITPVSAVEGIIASLDSTFSEYGYVTHNNAAGGSGTDSAFDMVLDDTGSIYVTGSSRGASNTDIALWKYNSDGTLDTSFSSDGVVTYDGLTGDDIGYALQLQDDGKIVLAGQIRGPSTVDLAVFRFNSDGSLDTTFGPTNNGIFTIAKSGSDIARDLIIQDDGSIVVVGDYANSNVDMFVIKLDEDGNLDLTFSGDGIFTHNGAAGGNGIDRGYAVTIQTDGDIVVAGESSNGSNSDVAIWRVLQDGTLDTSFDPIGNDGIVIFSNLAGGNNADIAYDVTLDQSGRILITGGSLATDSVEGFTVRLTDDGSLDTTFGTNGVVVLSNPVGYVAAEINYSLAIEPDGQIIVGGTVGLGILVAQGVYRFNTDGSLDTTFGPDGFVVIQNQPLYAGNSSLRKILIQPDGKYLFAGNVTGASVDMLMIRLPSEQNEHPLPSSLLEWQRISEQSDLNPTSSTNYNAQEFFDLVEFNGCIYAGVEGKDGTEEAQLFRTCDNGEVWEQVNDNGFGPEPTDVTPPIDANHNNDHVDSLVVFNDQIYVSTGTPNNAQEGTGVWRSSTGDYGSWTQVNTYGFGSSNNENLKDMLVYGDRVCGGTWNASVGAAVWCSVDGTTWEKVSPDGFGNPNNTIIWQLEVYNGYLYASAQNSIEGGEVWRSNDLIEWEQVVDEGYGYGTNETNVYMLQATDFGLFIGIRDGISNYLEIWVSLDGLSFNKSFEFDDIGLDAGTQTDYQGGYLYATFRNYLTGAEVWRSPDGFCWEQINEDGFGIYTNLSSTILATETGVYAGVINYAEGHQLWLLDSPPESEVCGLSTETPPPTPSEGEDIEEETLVNTGINILPLQILTLFIITSCMRRIFQHLLCKRGIFRV